MSIFLKNTYFSNKKDLPEVKISHHGKSFIAADWNYRNLNMPFWYLYWNETPGGTLIFGKQEIADHLGFADRYHFSKAFKTCFNLTSEAFRNQNQANNLPATTADRNSITLLRGKDGPVKTG